MEQFIIEAQNIAQMATDMLDAKVGFDILSNISASEKCNLYYI